MATRKKYRKRDKNTLTPNVIVMEKDLSVKKIMSSSEVLSLHLPKNYIFAKKGPR